MFYVILCGRGKKHKEVAHITMEADESIKTRVVHESAAKEFRNKFNLASNIDVQTATIFTAETRSEVKGFVDELDERIDERAAINGNHISL